MNMKLLVEELCSDACAGRAPGTKEGLEARRVVVGAMRGANGRLPKGRRPEVSGLIEAIESRLA